MRGHDSTVGMGPGGQAETAVLEALEASTLRNRRLMGIHRPAQEARAAPAAGRPMSPERAEAAEVATELRLPAAEARVAQRGRSILP